MLFYDWKKMYETCEGNTAEIVRVLRMLVEKQIPINHYDKIYKYYHIDFRGSSFLLHPDVLLYNAYQYSYKDICIYVAMASARSYAEYAAHGKLSLDRIHLTIDPFMFLDNPSLLRMDDEGVHFRYEEAPTEIH